jgi:hypothetical protein
MHKSFLLLTCLISVLNAYDLNSISKYLKVNIEKIYNSGDKKNYIKLFLAEGINTTQKSLAFNLVFTVKEGQKSEMMGYVSGQVSILFT